MSEFSIAGAGAIGLSIATLLQRAGIEVELLGRKGDACARDLSVILPCGEHVAWTCPVRLPSEERTAVARLIVATKAPGVAGVLASWRGGATYFLQNGRGFIPEDELGYSLINEAFSATAEAGLVRLHSIRPMWIGSEQLPEPVDDLAMLARAGLTCRWCEDIDRRRWEKIALNAAINPLSVLADATNGKTFAKEETRRRAEMLLGEAAALFETMDVAVSIEDLTALLEGVLKATSENTSSMLQDFRNGRAAVELPYINGMLLAAAAKHGVEMPEMRRVTKEVADRFEEKR